MAASSEAAPLRTRKARGQGATRRGEILDAAKRLFVEEGFEQATMRRIAAEVGVSPTALYLHFADKDAILAAIAEDFFAELLVFLEETQAGDAAPLVRLRAGLCGYVRFGVQRADEYRLTFLSQVARGGRVPCPEFEEADRSFAILEAAVAELMDLGLFRRMPQVLAAEAIWASLHGLTAALIDLDSRVESDREELIETVIDMAITGLLARN